jgi:uncharacterized protein (DUF302 family)
MNTMSIAMGMMKKAMFKVSQSRLSYEETVKKVHQQALDVGWNVPMVFELQKHYIEHGLSDMTKATNIYLCNPQGGYEIMKSDEFKPMSVMMPTPVSVYEDSAGDVFVARMNLGRMSAMFGGSVKTTLRDGGARLDKALAGVLID